MVDQITYLLDTNIISEVVKKTPDTEVMNKIKQFDGMLALPSVVLHELRFGWLSMPEGKRKQGIGQFIVEVVGQLPVLDYDARAARVHAEIRAEIKQKGETIPFVDGQIAAIAIVNGITLVTRNTKDFQAISGIRLDNWFCS